VTGDLCRFALSAPNSTPMQHSDEELIDAVVAALQAEKPVISDAVKSLISLVVASHATAADRAAAPKGAGDLAMVTSCGRALLKAINSHVLPPPPQWALEHPQAEQETALERIETMTTYRACHALAARCAKAGAKPTRMLGRGFLRGTRCWETVSDSCRAQLLEQRFPPPLVDTFLDRFGRSLAAGSEEEEVLVWAADLPRAIEERRRERQREVDERRERMDAGEGEAVALREALAAMRTGEGAAEESRIEDVTEEG